MVKHAFPVYVTVICILLHTIQILNYQNLFIILKRLRAVGVVLLVDLPLNNLFQTNDRQYKSCQKLLQTCKCAESAAVLCDDSARPY